MAEQLDEDSPFQKVKEIIGEISKSTERLYRQRKLKQLRGYVKQQDGKWTLLTKDDLKRDIETNLQQKVSELQQNYLTNVDLLCQQMKDVFTLITINNMSTFIVSNCLNEKKHFITHFKI